LSSAHGPIGKNETKMSTDSKPAMLTLEAGSPQARGRSYARVKSPVSPISMHAPAGSHATPVTDVKVRLVEGSDFEIRVCCSDAPDQVYRVYAASFDSSDVPLRFIKLIREGKKEDHGGYLGAVCDPETGTITVTVRFVKLSGVVLKKAVFMQIKGRTAV
jgi:hypothetical protein